MSEPGSWWWKYRNGEWVRVFVKLGWDSNDVLPNPFEPMGCPFHPMTGEPADPKDQVISSEKS